MGDDGIHPADEEVRFLEAAATIALSVASALLSPPVMFHGDADADADADDDGEDGMVISSFVVVLFTVWGCRCACL